MSREALIQGATRDLVREGWVLRAAFLLGMADAGLGLLVLLRATDWLQRMAAGHVLLFVLWLAVTLNTDRQILRARMAALKEEKS